MPPSQLCFQSCLMKQTGGNVESMPFPGMSRGSRELASARARSALKSRQLAIIGGITKAITSSLEFKGLLEIVFRETKKIIEFDRASLGLVDDSGKINIVYFLESPVGEKVAGGQIFPMDGTGVEWVIKNRRALIRQICNGSDAFREDDYIIKTGIKSGIVLPLIYRDRVIGTFNLGSRKENAYSKKDEEILGYICGSIAIALENARLYREVRDYARNLEEKVAERTMELRRSLSSLKSIQAKLIQAEKLAATSKLAAGMAHAIKNPLNAILISTNVIERSLRSKNSGKQVEKYCYESIAVVKEEIQKLLNLVNRFIAFGRPFPSRMQQTNVNDLVRQAVKSIQSELAQKRIRLTRSLARKLPRIRLDRDEFHQAILNLLRNSLEAVRAGGCILVATELRGERIILEVEDDGCGIAPDIQKNIFDIFFTTKSAGSGIGLSQVHRTVGFHGGNISVLSEPGRGAKFTIELPVKN